MKILKNSGNERVIDELRKCLIAQTKLDVASPFFSLFAFGEVRKLLYKLDKCRIVLPNTKAGDLGIVDSIADRSFRNRLQTRWLAKQYADWIGKIAEIKRVQIKGVRL